MLRDNMETLSDIFAEDDLKEARKLLIYPNDVLRIAAFYRDALQEKFPQYHHSLSIGTPTTNAIGATLRVFKKWDDGEPLTMLILIAYFLPNYLKINCNGMSGAGHKRVFDRIEFVDPRFTENILYDILREYHQRHYKDTWM